ncbi:hypothetical protein NDU88_004692 [Pleurodeles waltl]|uniref:Uncharacterized protein n=1 Tax=Pleurodeles waltl TaxID=8319 RepID=A0AAV7QJ51_PLEWA|nr:hypothetical protein NDU88_004692 [Pleurodeles waltl]
MAPLPQNYDAICPRPWTLRKSENPGGLMSLQQLILPDFIDTECPKSNVCDDPTPLQRLRPCDIIATL